MALGLTTVTLLDVAPPNVAVAPGRKHAPTIVTVLPPMTGPHCGATPAINGVLQGIVQAGVVKIE